MPYDAGSLAQLFGINFAPSFHFNAPNLANVRSGTELNPIAQATGVRMPYLGNFVGSGAGASGAGIGGILGGILGGLQSVFHFPTGPTQAGVGGVPATVGGIGDVSTIPAPGGVAKPPAGLSTGGKVAVGVGTGLAGAIGAMKAPALLGLGGMGGAVAGTRGFHMSKARKGHPSHLVRNRRMRVTNVKALRRGLRRLHGFEKICRRVLHFTHPRGARGRAVFRRARRRK